MIFLFYYIMYFYKSKVGRILAEKGKICYNEKNVKLFTAMIMK